MTPSTSAAGDDGRPAQLDRELRDLAARTVQRAFDVVQGRGALRLPLLWELAAAARPGWADLPDEERAGVLEQVIVRAVRALPADVAVPDTTMSWRRLGQIVFNLGPFDDRVMNAVIVATGENRYNRLVAYARRESGFTKSNQTFSDRIAKLRHQVAVVLSAGLGDAHTALSLPPGREPAPRGAYVVDQFFEALLQRVTSAAPELVSLVGEPGIGKTRLAREVCGRLLGSREVVWLRAGDEHDLYDDLVEFLRANGMPEVGPVLADAMLEFRRFLSRDSTPPTVVLDGVADLRTIKALIGPEPRRPVIATSHAPLAEPAATPMRGLRPSGAVALARSLAPDLPRWQAAAIGAMTGGRPGLIRGIVGLLGGSTGHLDVFDVWHALQTRPSAIIELIEPVAGNRLSSFYAERMRQLREHDRHTAATVELAAVHELDYTSPEIIARSLRHLHRINHRLAQAVVARTYAMLPRYGLQYPSRDPLVSALIREQGGRGAARRTCPGSRRPRRPSPSWSGHRPRRRAERGGEPAGRRDRRRVPRPGRHRALRRAGAAAHGAGRAAHPRRGGRARRSAGRADPVRPRDPLPRHPLEPHVGAHRRDRGAVRCAAARCGKLADGLQRRRTPLGPVRRVAAVSASTTPRFLAAQPRRSTYHPGVGPSTVQNSAVPRWRRLDPTCFAEPP